MDFLNEQGLQTLTNELVKAENIKFKSHRGDTVKKVIDNIARECEDVKNPYTMTLENKISSFKIGKNKDIDVSINVETSKVEVELKGKTYQNLCGSNVLVNAQYKDDYQSENTEDYIKTTRIADNNDGWFYYCNKALKVTMLKPNTFYTIFFRYSSNNNSIPNLLFAQGDTAEFLSLNTMSINLKDDIYRCVIKTIPSFEGKKIGKQVLYFHNAVPKKVGEYTTIYKKMLVLEGDYSDLSIEEIPKYFTEIKSSFENEVIDIEVQGKNLLDLNTRVSDMIGVTHKIIGNSIIVSSDSTSKIYAHTKLHYPKELFEGKTVTFSCKASANSTSSNPIIQVYYTKAGTNKENWIFFWNKSNTHTFPENIEGNDVVIQIHTNNTPNAGVENTVTIKELQAEICNVKTNYEPYYKKKISFDIGEPLRSLPNGVCDEIRNNNGRWELVRRVGKTVLDGQNKKVDAYHPKWSSGDYFAAYTSKISDQQRRKGGTSIFVDTLTALKHPNTVIKNGVITAQCCWAEDYTYAFYVAINKSYLESDSIGAVNKWLQQNPTTVYYELETPIIEPIEPIEFEVKPLATMTINSEIVPTSNHKVILNKAGQIEQGVIQVAELRKRINNLETAYDSYLLETQHKLSILDFEYELESEDED